MNRTILLLSISILILNACTHRASDTTLRVSTRTELLQILEQTAASNKILFGHEDDMLYGHNWWAEPNRSDVKEVCGDYPAIVGFDLGGIETGDSVSIDRVPFSQIREAAIDHYNRGGIISISWHLCNPVTGGNSWDVSCDTVVKSILGNGTEHDLFLTWLNRLSDFLLSLKTDSCEQIPIIFRPWHEHNGYWFWWGQTHCTTEEYKDLWKLVKEYLDGKGLKNILYAYSPNLGATAETYMERYPGDDIIDLLGFDIYQFLQKNDTSEIIDDGTESYINETRKALALLTELGKQHHKPIAFTETGLEGLPIDNWYTHILIPAVEEFPISYLLVWRNANDKPEHFYAPYPGNAAEKDFIEFYRLPKTVFLNDLQYSHEKRPYKNIRY